jgi:diguanylate cyclase (GGDEF)-like protein
VPSEFLTQVLGQSAHVQKSIEQSAEELACLNVCIKHELAYSDPQPKANTFFDKNEAATRKLHDACEQLAAVNQALRIEIKNRTMLDYQHAATVEQKEGSRLAALHDNLTGLPNRALFTDRLEHGIAQAKRHRWTLAVMFVDLDNFKVVNDTYGHPAGDAILQAVATRLKRNTRSEDTVSRYGGDEFLYLVTQLHNQRDIATIAAKILKAIEAPCNVVRDLNVDLCLKASIGIAVFPKDGVTASALIKSADEAMYAAKESKAGVAFTQEFALFGVAQTGDRPPI